MTHKNPLRDLHRFGVSVWYDYVSRSLISSGQLKRLIEDDGVRGVTSNPTIFEKAIGSSSDYDDAIRRHAKPGQAPAELFEKLAVEDIQAACDAFRALYDESKGGDGFVSLEVAPSLARDPKGTVAEAERLWALVARPNLMVKVPGTVEGLKAFEDLTAAGLSINVTLLFAQDRYAAVAEAYLKGLERRAAAGKDLSRVASVASFFVSRVDTAIDAVLEKRPEAAAKELLGKAAIANAKLAYQHGKAVFGSKRWTALAAKGARPQRLLWASTGTKNPNYKDVLYVEELIGLDTVNTMPPATVDAYRDHGAGRFSLEDRLDEARAQWDALPKHGVDLAGVMAKLEDEGLKSFEKSFETLMGKLAAKRALLEAENAATDKGLAELEHKRFAERLWAKDAALWKDDAGHQKIIKHSLGWLTAPETSALGMGQVRAFVDEVAAEGLAHVVVLGMGGSSLCVETLRRVLPLAPGRPRLHVLDSTHPDAVTALERELDLDKTLFLFASKSGSTIEPNCLFDHFWAGAQKRAGAKAGRRFAAITDPGTFLEKLSRERGFRKTFLNPSDVGGRFSALTLFGLVPAALGGADAAGLLERARAAAKACSPAAPTRENPGLRLGAALGAHARDGRDKLTLVLDPRLEAFGLWIERRRRAAGRAVGVRPRPPVRAPVAQGPRGPGRRQEARRARGRRASRRPPGAGRRAGPGRAVLRLGGRDRGRRLLPRRGPVRPARRAVREGQDQGAARRLGRRAPARREGRLPRRRAVGLRRRRAQDRAEGRRRPGPAAARGARRAPGARRAGRLRVRARLSGGDRRQPPRARRRPPPGARAHDGPGDRVVGSALPALDRPAVQGRRQRRRVPDPLRRGDGPAAGPGQAVHLHHAVPRAGARRRGRDAGRRAARAASGTGRLAGRGPARAGQRAGRRDGGGAVRLSAAARKARLRKIRLVLTDVDGVLTGGTI
ncbi:MAG: bifunctional transaldolase/phosoglucose isomerase, partial [Elusimicrobia bacterium]|nr:bifunctional transaldolase/phosoglucose isomerase [Elusimicrobiota bacterium]